MSGGVGVWGRSPPRVAARLTRHLRGRTRPYDAAVSIGEPGGDLPFAFTHDGRVYLFPPPGERSPEVQARCEAILGELHGLFAETLEDVQWVGLRRAPPRSAEAVAPWTGRL